MKVVAIDVGLKNLSICIINFDSTGEYKILFWKTIDCVTTWLDNKKKFPKKPSIQNQVDAVIFALQSLNEEFSGVEHVWIENQPVGVRNACGNTAMKCIQHSIQSYFLINFPTAAIAMVSPGIKLGKQAPKEYGKRKKLAVTTVLSILKNSEKNCILSNPYIQQITQSKKADDLADSFLIAYNYYKKLNKNE